MASTPRSRLSAIAVIMLAIGLIGLAVVLGLPLAQGQGLGMTLWGYIAFAIAGTGLVLLIVSGAMARAAKRNESR